MAEFSFSKKDKLSGEKTVAELFKKGKALNHYPLRFVFTSGVADLPLVLVSVSGRKFKRAVDRNLIKRRMRECWRLSGKNFMKALPINPEINRLAIIYIGKEISAFEVINKRLISGLKKLTTLPEAEKTSSKENETTL